MRVKALEESKSKRGGKHSNIVMIGPSMSLARGGMASVVLAYKDAGLFEKWPIIYLETHRETSSIHKFLLGLMSLFRFINLLVYQKVVLLHANIAGSMSFFRKSVFMLAAHSFGVPFIIHVHGSAFKVFYEKGSGKLLRLYIRFVFDHASAIIALSEEWRLWLSGITTNSNICLIRNPVQLPSNVNRDDMKPRVQNVLFLGKLVSQKGITDILKAFVTVIEKSSIPVHLWCGGDGDRETIESQIKELKLTPHVTVLGWIQGESKERQLRQADVLVLPSYNEVLPMAILEALAYGVPVVASRIGGIPDAITDGVEGFLIEPGDINAISESILKIVSNTELRKIMRENARAKVESFFEDRMIVNQVSQIYKDLRVIDHAI